MNECWSCSGDCRQPAFGTVNISAISSDRLKVRFKQGLKEPRMSHIGRLSAVNSLDLVVHVTDAAICAQTDGPLRPAMDVLDVELVQKSLAKFSRSSVRHFQRPSQLPEARSDLQLGPLHGRDDVWLDGVIVDPAFHCAIDQTFERSFRSGAIPRVLIADRLYRATMIGLCAKGQQGIVVRYNLVQKKLDISI